MILSVLIVFLLLMPISQSLFFNDEIQDSYNNLTENDVNLNNYKSDDNLVEIHVSYVDIEKNYQKTIIKISKLLYENFIQELSDINNQDIDIIDYLQKKLQIMKNYKLVSDDIEIQNIIDFSKIGNLNTVDINISEVNSFSSNFAPIFLLGMGFGLGFGYRRMPVMQRIAGNLFSVGVIGLGTVVCFDLLDAKIYYQYTFTFPYLIHILSGFIGIMMFAFDNIFPPDNGSPFTMYSNFIALGMAGVAIGFKFPPV
jgi:hypothetical protein